MARFFTLLLLTLLCTCVSAQKPSLSVVVENGIAAAFTPERETGVAFNLGLEYQRPIAANFHLFMGAGLQYTSFKDRSRGAIPCDFPLGDKVVTFTNSDRYQFNRYDATVSLGLEKRMGKLSLRGSLIPAYLLRDRIDVELLTYFSQPNRPDSRAEATVNPGDSFMNGGQEVTVDYSTRFQLQGGVEALYAVTDRFSLGLGYRRSLTKYELETRSTLTVCSELNCIPVEVDNSSIDARAGSGFLVLRFKL